MDKNCKRCSKPVYFKEQKLAAGVKWHKACFKCAVCNKKLDSTMLCEHKNEIYCKSCHGRQFGPKGYGFGQGAGALSMETVDTVNTPHKSDFNVHSAGSSNGNSSGGGGGFGGVAKPKVGGGAKACRRCNTPGAGNFCQNCGGRI